MNNGLYEKVSQLRWLTRRMREIEQSGNPLSDTSKGQGRILAVLKLKDEISTKELSYVLGIRVSSLNELLLKMEKTNYITRIPAEDDKRVMLVKLTEVGRAVPLAEDFDYEQIFACLNEQEKANLAEYLDRVVDSLCELLGVDEAEKAEKLQSIRERLEDVTTRHRHRGCRHHNKEKRAFKHKNDSE